ncbi:MAG: hypothetical protein V3W41_21920 [Planctomycetota bacterium]
MASEQKVALTEGAAKDEARRRADEVRDALTAAQEEADKHRAVLAEQDAETWATARDQHNNPVRVSTGTRQQRRKARSKKGANKTLPALKHRKKKAPRRRKKR